MDSKGKAATRIVWPSQTYGIDQLVMAIQDENATEFLCDLCEQESSWSSKQKPNLNYQNGETPSIPRLESICRPKTPWTKRMFVSSKILQHCQIYILLLFLRAFPKGTCGLLLGWLCTGEKEIIRLFRNYWTLALNWHWVQDIQNTTAVLVQARACRGQVINGVLAQVHLIWSLHPYWGYCSSFGMHC